MKFLRFEQEGALGQITVQRPEALNALTPELASASQDVFYAALPAYKRLAKRELFNIDSIIASKAEREKEIFEANLHTLLETEIFSGVERLTSNQLQIHRHNSLMLQNLVNIQELGCKYQYYGILL